MTFHQTILAVVMCGITGFSAVSLAGSRNTETSGTPDASAKPFATLESADGRSSTTRLQLAARNNPKCDYLRKCCAGGTDNARKCCEGHLKECGGGKNDLTKSNAGSPPSRKNPKGGSE